MGPAVRLRLLTGTLIQTFAVTTMLFFISGELDSEIADAFRPIRKDIKELLNDYLGSRNYGAAIEKISFIPIILGSRFTSRPERELVQHMLKVADYRVAIEYELFLNGSGQSRKQLLIESLLLVVADIGKKFGRKFESQRLTQDISALFDITG